MIDVSEDLKKHMTEEDITHALAKCVRNGTLPVTTLSAWLNYGTIDAEALEKAKFITPAQQKANKQKNIVAGNVRSVADSSHGLKGVELKQGPDAATKPAIDKSLQSRIASTDPTSHKNMAAYRKGQGKHKEAAAHIALAAHHSGEKPLSEMEVARHKKTLTDAG